jgi:predicted DNA-binding transcriptional regulator YafY
MPSSDHETTIARQWELLRNHLPSRPPGITTRNLRERLDAAGHNVSKRTIERDMDELSRIFPIVRNERGIPYGWHWRENARFDVLGMDLSEAVSLGLMEDVLRQIMPPAFLSALEGKFSLAREKLAALPKIPHARWKDLVRYVPPGMPFIPPTVAPGVLSAIQEALLQQRQLKMVYLKPDQEEPKEYTIHPLSLIHQGARTYLLATVFHYENPVLYAIHRMTSAEVLDVPIKRLKAFSLDKFIDSGAAQFGSGEMITLQAKIDYGLRMILSESPISKDQKITTRGGVHTLTAHLPDTWQLHFWILSQGASITIIKPTSLRKAVITSLNASISNYSCEK